MIDKRLCQHYSFLTKQEKIMLAVSFRGGQWDKSFAILPIVSGKMVCQIEAYGH